LAPTLQIIANGDPIAEAGIKAMTKKDVAEYPVLCCTLNSEIIVGYKPEDYDRVIKLYHNLAASGAFGEPGPPDQFSGQQQPVDQNPTQATKVPSGTN